MKWQLAALGLLLALPQVADAGRRPFIWAWDPEIVPEGDVELEQWLWWRSSNPANPLSKDVYWVWWAPVIGVTDQLELSIPFQLLEVEGNPAVLESFEVELHYRLFSRLSTLPVQPMVRAVWHQATGGGQNRVDANLVGSMPNLGPVHLTLDLGGRFALASEGRPSTILGSYDLGASVAVTDELRVSLEALGEIPLQGLTQGQHHFLGPSISWTRGRFWINAGAMIGLTGPFPETPTFMPRIIWAVAL